VFGFYKKYRGKQVNKNDLIAAIVEETGMTKNDVGKALDAMMSVVGKRLKSGGDVRLVGFGTFAVTHRSATKGRNPRTGAEIDIPAARVPKFKPGKALKDLVAD
jgi:DNA-binding protein HU-beta